jgi:hypothetical protein
VKFKLIKLISLSGKKTTIYSAIIDDDSHTLFDNFLAENIDDYKNELVKIRTTIETIAHKTGARESFFDKHEGKVGQSVYALYDRPDSKLRLYCFRFDNQILILGGGGFKPRTIRTLQEDPKLLAENSIMRYISDTLTQAIKDKTIKQSFNYMELQGILEFDEDDTDDTDD